MSLRLLMVDDDPSVIRGLSRMLMMLEPSWDLEAATDGNAALELLSKSCIDVVISDMRMPQMTGDRFLEEVRNRYPSTVRLLLTGQADSSTSLRSIGPAHQFLSKPCEPETVIRAIKVSMSLRTLLEAPELVQMVGATTSLPPAPSLYMKLVKELDKPDASLTKAAEIISDDVAMTAKILQLVNSSFFGLARQVTSVSQAATYLGIDTLRSIVAFADAFGKIDVQAGGFSIEALQSHSMQVGNAANRLARYQADPNVSAEDAMLAGLLHDAGKLLLAHSMGDEYTSALEAGRAKSIPEHEIERTAWGSSHAEAGAYLLALWGLPDRIVEAVANHHQPERAPFQEFGLASCIAVADALVRKQNGLPAQVSIEELCSQFKCEDSLAATEEYLNDLAA